MSSAMIYWRSPLYQDTGVLVGHIKPRNMEIFHSVSSGRAGPRLIIIEILAPRSTQAMPIHPSNVGIWISIALAGLAHAHMAPFHKAMYCINGSDPNVVNRNSNAACDPLYNLTYSDFWFHHSNGCDKYPPEEGVFLELPAGGSFTMEMADNRACTSLNADAILTPWGDGMNHPDDYSITNLGGFKITPSGCIDSPNLHAQNESMASGTAFAIAYESEIDKVTPENLVVFSVRHNTPWKRIIKYDVPSGMPACPEAGCLCTYVWIPNACGQPNMNMFPYKCKVITDSTPPKTIGTPKPAVWCEDDKSKCVEGPKQIMIWNQLDSNNIKVEGNDLSGYRKSPAYNAKCGFNDGAQNDIFVDGSGASTLASRAGHGAHAKRMTMRRERSNIF
ncbi:hypothetical protein HD554DRAFT_2133492 [Boletus coccyginus]|nr:hypothetical protein HD554DRAFT_2133492 [Boletus coccyginus]